MAAKYIQLADLMRGEIVHLRSIGENRLPTEKELTESYGVSRQTVRNALNLLEEEGLIERRQGSGSYIREKILGIGMKQIAVITTFIDDYIFPSILHDAQSIFEQNGYSTLIYATENKVSKEREILKSLLEKEISAILIEGSKTALPTPNADLFIRFRMLGIPVLFIHGEYQNLKEFPSVLADDYAGGYMLAEYLIAKGHRKIAGIFKNDDMQGSERYYGYLSALVRHDLLFDEKSICWYDTDERKEIVDEDDKTKIDRIIERIGETTAAVCYNDEIAYALIRRLSERGYRIPEDIAIVSFDDSFYSRIGTVPITSLAHRDQRTGKTAAGMLMAMLKGEEVNSIRLRWEIKERASS